MSEHDRVLTGVVEEIRDHRGGSYWDVTCDDFSKDSHDTLGNILSGMIGERVLITIDKYPTADG